jgi:hypothetical protein
MTYGTMVASLRTSSIKLVIPGLWIQMRRHLGSYQHGADIEAKEYPKLWLCKICHSNGLKCGNAKVMKYFNLIKSSDLYYAAVILHPAYKFEYSEQKWAGYDRGDWIREVKASFSSLYKQYARRHEESQLQVDSDQDDDTPAVATTTNEYAAFNTLKPRKRRRIEPPHSEYERYFKYWSEDDQAVITNVIKWWQEHRTEYPILSTMALDILSIPGMSAEVERVFSAGGRLITDERNALGPDAVKACQLQKHWMKQGIV